MGEPGGTGSGRAADRGGACLVTESGFDLGASLRYTSNPLAVEFGGVLASGVVARQGVGFG